MSLVFVDLDHFKKINDSYGHPAGDTVLRETAKLILKTVRDTDFVARYGGEEFVIIMPGLEQPLAIKVCERLLATLRMVKHVFGGRSVGATASMGLATLSPSTPFASFEHLLNAADQSVYVAKRAGRDRLIVHGDHVMPAQAKAG
jgi:diguanylate cyclase (GGDEF)-like protein